MLTRFNEMPIVHRLMLAVILAAGVAGLIAVALWTQDAEKSVLFANLSPEDAGTIVEKLKDAKVPYELGAGSTSVLVPSSQVHDLRLQLAGQGLPHGGGVGFEIFDRTTLGMSDFVQKLNYRRALQGELARTIAQMPEVERARVHLAVPERRLFSADQSRARASVVVSLRAGGSLGKVQAQGIVHLVASSVEGLEARDVTVLDGHGRLLSGTAEESGARLTGSQLDYQQSVEKDIESRIQSMLERIVGTNKAVVRVSSHLDFRQVETTEERFDPNSQVVRSEQRSQERANGANSLVGGVPGVASNVPPGTAAEPAPTSTNNSQTKNETLNYEISRTVSRIVEPTGMIKKLSVAVLVDGTYEPIKAGEAGTPPGSEAARKYVPRSEAEMKRIEDLVKKAMGYSEERQDQLEVVNVQFDVVADEGAGTVAEAGPAGVAWGQYVRYGVGVGLFVLMLVFVVRPVLNLLASSLSSSAPLPNTPLPASVSQVEASIAAQPRAQITDLARSNPESTALVVKQWLKSNA